MRTFKPNLTSEMLLSCAESIVNESSRTLDLGCGSGYVGIQLAKSTKLKELCCSDLDKKSFKKVSIEAKKYMVNLHFMQGSLFEPWQGEKFDLIVSDISPNKTGNSITDQYHFFQIAGEILEFSKKALKSKGSLVMKVFIGLGFEEFVKESKLIFRETIFFKPKSSTQKSKETYLIASSIRL